MLRVLFGVAVLVAPRLLLRGLIRTAPERDLKFLARLFASREIALGAATLDALDRPGPRGLGLGRGRGRGRGEDGSERSLTRIVQLNLAVDAADGTAALLAGRHLPASARWFTVLGASGAVATAAGFLRSRSLDR